MRFLSPTKSGIFPKVSRFLFKDCYCISFGEYIPWTSKHLRRCLDPKNLPNQGCWSPKKSYQQTTIPQNLSETPFFRRYLQKFGRIRDCSDFAGTAIPLYEWIRRRNKKYRSQEVGDGCCCSVFSVIQVNGMKHQHLKDWACKRKLVDIFFCARWMAYLVCCLKHWKDVIWNMRSEGSCKSLYVMV